jgi:hypothetical protein
MEARRKAAEEAKASGAATEDAKADEGDDD